MNPIMFNKLIPVDVDVCYTELFEFADPDHVHASSYGYIKCPLQNEDDITLCVGVYNIASGIDTTIDRITF